MIVYKIESELCVEEFIAILVNSSLAERRPAKDPDRIKRMLENGNLIVTARIEGEIVGVARSLTDFVYATYLSDLAVDEKYQNRGIGKELIRQTKLATPQAKLILLSAPKVINYYPKIGMNRHEQCFFIDNVDELK